MPGLTRAKRVSPLLAANSPPLEDIPFPPTCLPATTSYTQRSVL